MATARTNKGKGMVITFTEHNHDHKSRFNTNHVAPAYEGLSTFIRPSHGMRYLGQTDDERRDRQKRAELNLAEVRTTSLMGVSQRVGAVLDEGLNFAKPGIKTLQGERFKWES
jgi:hypothetical protein